MTHLPAVETTLSPDGRADAAVVWLHGLGADGNDFAPVVPELGLSARIRTRFVFPHAPVMPVTINNGMAMPAWYDIKGMDEDARADREGLRRSAAKVRALIEREVERGVDSARIVVAGFSQGGAVAYEAALSWPRPLAGLLALSSYFPTADSVRVSPAQRALPVMICHGDADPLVPEALGRQAAEALRGFGLEPEYRSYPMEHAVCPREIADIGAWITRVLGRRGAGPSAT